MTFLNFSTKNIAQYTFVTVRAVQIRKNRLRKKLNIASDIDFNNWMRDQVHRTPHARQERSVQTI
jgi:DNA-binding NarL/FixJ family response regulator